MAIMEWFLPLCILFISASANIHIKVTTDNPADQLVAALNTNRTAKKLSSLYSNPGLACIALQYIKAYEGDCGEVGGSDAKKPRDSAFAETFAPNCGVDAKSLAEITGRFLACQSKYIEPSKAFSEVLIRGQKSLDILYSKNHSEVGAAVSGSDGGGPYFWCVLFSNGKSNSSFALRGGVAKVAKPGCFSGANDDCSGADALSRRLQHLWSLAALVAVVFACGSIQFNGLSLLF
nr:Pathogenesis-related PR-1 type [Ipomoea batatas]